MRVESVGGKECIYFVEGQKILSFKLNSIWQLVIIPIITHETDLFVNIHKREIQLLLDNIQKGEAETGLPLWWRHCLLYPHLTLKCLGSTLCLVLNSSSLLLCTVRGGGWQFKQLDSCNSTRDSYWILAPVCDMFQHCTIVGVWGMNQRMRSPCLITFHIIK